MKNPVACTCTCGVWTPGDTDAPHNDIDNRRITLGNSLTTVTLQVLNRKDSGGGAAPCQSTALQPNVHIISTSFEMPQLKRTRRVWIYLPNDYATNPTKRYPVLYLHDGQNVFDTCTSFAGEWGVDETLSELQQQGLDATGSIAVAIDHGGTDRLNELSPWRNLKLGGGQGDQYVDFLVETLKPYIDAHYRTLTGREFTGIVGSSMGGLISTYAALKYPNVYSKVGVFSPAFWFAQQSLFQYVRQHPAHPDTRFYFVCGTTEGQNMVPLMRAMHDALVRGGVPAANLSFNPQTDGQHSEWFWRREFPAAYQWLSAPPSTQEAAAPLPFSAYATATKEEVLVELPAGLQQAQLTVTDKAGQVMFEAEVGSGDAVKLSGLPRGIYMLRVSAGKYTGVQMLVT
ncbi:alpha/beta hydrolase-fold protein [Hymenobacter tibetensis]|uniref:Alpha/beta hydrolase-fold protein n=1 Tax=Hymenobacter tibetensis TaxID=497967 RepID=A0ABY4D2N7_9BACT|nr:alpha/beta hydrolase-fold protein [Hymenobacter tibetensis]UOG76663.1 alpha/beta hydrolase-fold protein [Hymenobacter tibetensis]